VETRVCRRCGYAICDDDVPGVELQVMAGTGWSTHTRHLVLCDSCGVALDRWIAGVPEDHRAPGGALADTAVASMSLTGPW
jgi:hypothetical protein